MKITCIKDGSDGYTALEKSRVIFSLLPKAKECYLSKESKDFDDMKKTY